MKHILLASILLLALSDAQAQNRKHASNFSLFQHFYNPALTGHSGSAIKTFYRNQWAGFDGAPTTLFASGELILGEQTQGPDGALQPVKAGIGHAAGLSILHDTFGPFVENLVTASYRSQVNLTEKLAFQAGGALAWHGQSLDGSRLTAGESADPSMTNYIDQTSRSGRLDFNIGLSLTGENFYAGYAMQNLRGGVEENKQDFFRNNSKLHYVVQAGYRRPVSDQIGIAVNGLFRYDDQLKESIEGQVKGIFYNTAWFGMGYRKSLAYSFTAGFRIDHFTAGYSYEIPTGDAHRVDGTNEIMLTYDLQRMVYPKLTRKMSMW